MSNQAAELYLLEDPRSGATVEVGGAPLAFRGDPGLARQLAGELSGAVLGLTSDGDLAGGAHGTSVRRLSQGDPGWLAQAVHLAAERLGLLCYATLGRSGEGL